MSTPRFLIPQNPYPSVDFLAWRSGKEAIPEEAPHYFFRMARYALYRGLGALGVVAGDEILVPAYICDAAIQAIQAFGAVPVFFRITRDCSPDLEDVERRLSRRTRAVLVVHYFGFPQNLHELRDLCNRRRLFLLEDCAHVLAGQAEGKRLGSTGDISVFSWRKFLPTSDGAKLVINAKEGALGRPLHYDPLLTDLRAIQYLVDIRFAEQRGTLRKALQLPAKLLTWNRRAASQVPILEEHSPSGNELNGSDFDPRFTDSLASRVSQFYFTHSDLQAVVEKRRQNYLDLAKRLSNISGVVPLFPDLPDENCPLYFPLFCGQEPGAHRRLRGLGIPATAWDGVRPQEVLDERFPEAAFLYENLIFLPVHQSLRQGDLDLIADTVKSVSHGGINGPITRAIPLISDQQKPALRDPAVLIQAEHDLKAQARREGNDHRGKVLFVAYHFPPQMGSSGLLRCLKYCRYLPEQGWTPTVLTVHPRAYEQVDSKRGDGVGLKIKIIRAFALDTKRHLSVGGHYLRFTALPDRWITWCIGALPRGVLEIYKKKINVIFSTHPIGSAVLIGYLLHRITGVPWVADFRDPMTEADYPADARIRRLLRWLEKKVVRHATLLIFTTQSTMRMYLQRYPELSPEKCHVISNGYDEEDFREFFPFPRRAGARLRVQHSGLIYPKERNPIPFFQALARLKKDGKINASWLSIDLRACGNEDHYRNLVEQLGIDDLVRFLPILPYQDALQDTNETDLLLLLQDACCDHQIPAKAYEYLRLGKPILALTSHSGDTAALLEECGGATIVDIADENAIYKALPEMLDAVRRGKHPLPSQERVSRYSRQNQARQLATCLSEIVWGASTEVPTSRAERSESGL